MAEDSSSFFFLVFAFIHRKKSSNVIILYIHIFKATNKSGKLSKLLLCVTVLTYVCETLRYEDVQLNELICINAYGIKLLKIFIHIIIPNYGNS